MLLDNQARRASEINAIIATPYNEVLSAVVRDREANFSDPIG
jgi:hypothetical protein